MDYVRPSGHFEQGREEAYFLRRKPSVIDRAQGTGHRAQGTGHRAQGTEHRAQGLRDSTTARRSTGRREGCFEWIPSTGGVGVGSGRARVRKKSTGRSDWSCKSLTMRL